jgi:hypothetical protein
MLDLTEEPSLESRMGGHGGSEPYRRDRDHPQGSQEAAETVDRAWLGMPPASCDQAYPGQRRGGGEQHSSADIDDSPGEPRKAEEGKGQSGEEDGARRGTGGESRLADQRTQWSTRALQSHNDEGRQQEEEEAELAVSGSPVFKANLRLLPNPERHFPKLRWHLQPTITHIIPEPKNFSAMVGRSRR